MPLPTRLFRAIVPLLAAATVAVAACGASDLTAPSSAGVTAAASAVADPGNGSVAAAAEPASAVPSDTGQPAATDPTPDPTAAGPTPTDATTPGSLPGVGPAAGCSGSDANRDFFSGAAAGVDWPVYCAVLPDGWFVQTGSYRLRDGGLLRIAYSGPNGARIELREGGTCVEDPSCVPSGTSVRSVAFGDRTGTLIALDGGGYAVSVDGGKPVSWLLIAANMDEALVRSTASALRAVGSP